MRCEVHLAHPAAPTPALLDLLDPVEQVRGETYARAVDRARFLTGRVMAKALVGRELGVPPRAVRFDSTCPDCDRPHGKPRVGGGPELSISHSGDRVAVALAAAPVGVDVEQVVERELMAELVRMSLTEREQSALTTPVPGFFTYWSRKEAVLKATGKGLAVPMRAIAVSAPDEQPALLDGTKAGLLPATTHLVDIDAGPGYRACVAVLGDAAPQVRVLWADDLVKGLS
ncbi:4'-phosphopantetheinyl transferase family protein [Actinokineospora iranica]|uniref:4'-phosphopantetheinyl transferase n=1 Tax=Actinokineospora iranica TaxID=1271860 RepID=A0A1G6TJR8_9PSEU|nr:4'-phosphopantetheinyl transferase superfamily protein [Actinokineospora iranica]SDD29313.1 4'-phosphopantetheinyl transferase [Actinokineospora iranica]